MNFIVPTILIKTVHKQQIKTDREPIVLRTKRKHLFINYSTQYVLPCNVRFEP